MSNKSADNTAGDEVIVVVLVKRILGVRLHRPIGIYVCSEVADTPAQPESQVPSPSTRSKIQTI